MTEETATKLTAETSSDLKTWKRRGLLAAAWAAVASLVARQTTQPLEAGVDGDVVLGAVNTTAGETRITNTGTDTTALALHANGGSRGIGVFGQGSGYGVLGATTSAQSVNSAGVYGASLATNGPGVWGFNEIGSGVLGQTLLGAAGVRGEVLFSGSNNSIAVYGANNSDYESPVPGGGGFGVVGVSRKGHGVVGAAQTSGASAVVGATNGLAGAYAGVFFGPVVVQGNLVVGGAKSAAVPHPDGSHCLLYCMESPESWFEDFGKGTLECGRTEVTIDPNFAALAEMEGYQVFLTGYDHDYGLYVTDRTASGFTVQADLALARLKGQSEDQLSGAFGWRIVAKRKDIVGERLAKVTMPPEPQLPIEPPMSEAPTPPELHSRMARR